jgi:3'(2'), 5'-bisphosphate nucleotidase
MEVTSAAFRTEAFAAAEIAEAAGEKLLAVRDDFDPTLGEKALRDRGDLAAEDLIAAALADRFEEDAILSEEAADDLDRLEAERVWIIDPLDGTREYAEGRSDWAVHVAFWAFGELRCGAVALPGAGVTLSSVSPPQVPPRDGPVRLLVSRTRPPDITEALRAALDAELVEMGSAGAKTMAILRGEGDVYAHAGGQHEWDSAAPVAVAASAGLHVSRLDGSELVYNSEDPWLPDLLVCRAELADAVFAALA